MAKLPKQSSLQSKQLINKLVGDFPSQAAAAQAPLRVEAEKVAVVKGDCPGSQWPQGFGGLWRWWEFVVVAMACAALIAFSWPWMNRLGLNSDEAYCLPAAVRIAFGSPGRLQFPYGLYLAGRPIPFMLAPYIGPLDAYVYSLVFATLGCSIPVFRAANLAISILFLALTYTLARELWNRWAAALVLALLMTDVEFLLHAPTNNVGPILIQLISSTALVLFFNRWLRSGQAPGLWRAAFFAGLGLSEKLTFILFLFGLALALAIFYWRRLLATHGSNLAACV